MASEVEIALVYNSPFAAALRTNVSLGAIADISLGSNPSEINRLDWSRNVSLTIELDGKKPLEVNEEASQLPSYQNLPQGMRFVEPSHPCRSSCVASFSVPKLTFCK